MIKSVLLGLSLSLSLLSVTASANIPSRDLIDYARQFKGVTYEWGGTDPSGFDCSGYLYYVYRKFGIEVPRVTKQYPQLFHRKIPLEQARPGDMIIFTGTDPSDRRPGHAGIITRVGPDRLDFLHSSSSKRHYGVTETNYFDSNYPRRFLAVIRMS